tara:strand:- start:136 stop:609 length:474 start_codon:yes stop_codon:yes gene_type:complete
MLYSKKNIIDQVHLWKEERKDIVFTNGCFDLLHKGHIELLKKAKYYGQILIVGLNSDSSVKFLKGDKRPIENQKIRAKNLLKLDFVNAVCIFEEKTPIKLIKSVRPNFLIKGGDYNKTNVVGSDIIENWDGKVIIIPLIKGYSTTSIIKKKEREDLV